MPRSLPSLPSLNFVKTWRISVQNIQACIDSWENLNMAATSEPQKKSRLDWRKEKELEEARKAGTAPALTDEEGK